LSTQGTLEYSDFRGKICSFVQKDGHVRDTEMKIRQGFIGNLKPRLERYRVTRNNLETRVELSGRIPLTFKYKIGVKKKRVKIAQLGSTKATRDEAKILDLEYQNQVYRRTQFGDLIGVAEKGFEKREAVKNNKTLAQVSAECLTEFNKTGATGSSGITRITIIRSQF